MLTAKYIYIYIYISFFFFFFFFLGGGGVSTFLLFELLKKLKILNKKVLFRTFSILSSSNYRKVEKIAPKNICFSINLIFPSRGLRIYEN